MKKTVHTIQPGEVGRWFFSSNSEAQIHFLGFATSRSCINELFVEQRIDFRVRYVTYEVPSTFEMVTLAIHCIRSCIRVLHAYACMLQTPANDRGLNKRRKQT